MTRRPYHKRGTRYRYYTPWDPQANAPELAGLAGWWPMYDAGGMMVRNLANRNQSGTIVNANSANAWVRSNQGIAIELDGTDNRIDIDDPVTLATEPTTIMMWIVQNDYAGNQYFCTGHQFGNAGLANMTCYTGGGSANRAFGLFMDGVTQNYTLLSQNNIVPTNQPNHFVWSHDGSGDVSMGRLYLNGVRITSFQTEQSLLGPRTGDGSFSIGGRIYDNNRNVDGQIWDVRRYTRQVPHREIVDIYNDSFKPLRVYRRSLKEFEAVPTQFEPFYAHPFTK